jgi:hypothetical protein
MRSCAPSFATLSLFVASAAFVVAAEPDEEVLAARIARLIKQLGDDSFAQREAASGELEAIDAPAAPALRKAADADDDPEIRVRAGRILQAIARHACQRELTKLSGSWKSPDGVWLKITGDRWSSGTPTFGPVAGTMWISEIKDKIVFVDFAVEKGPTKGHHPKAIVRLDGDALHYCATYDGQYPTEFKTVGNCFTCVFQRMKE